MAWTWRIFFAVGDSAGGQILSLYADICTNAEYAKEYDFQVPEGLKIKAVALNCGQYNMEDTSDSDWLDYRAWLSHGKCDECLPLVSGGRV